MINIVNYASVGFIRQKKANILPKTQCVTALIAPGTGAKGSMVKCVDANSTPSPLFCIPTSMDTPHIDAIIIEDGAAVGVEVAGEAYRADRVRRRQG